MPNEYEYDKKGAIPLTKIQTVKKAKGIAFSVVRAVFLLSFGYVVLYPLLYMISRAIMAPIDATDPSVVWLPQNFSFQNFKIAFEAMDFANTALRTVTVQVVSAVVEMIVCSVIAYGFARYDFPGKNLLFILVVITMIVPSQAIVVPLYLNYANLDLLGIVKLINQVFDQEIRINILNTGWTFYLPSLFGIGLKSGLFIFIYRQFFRSFPKELDEAASIDGAGPIRTLISIVYPSSGMAFLCVFLFSLIAHWNDYYLSAMFFSEGYPLSVQLSQLDSILFSGGFGLSVEGRANVTLTACLMFLTPILILYLFLQRRFIESIESVGIVG